MSVAWGNQGSENLWDKVIVPRRHFPHSCFLDEFWLQDYLVIFERVQKDGIFLFFPLNLCMFQHKRRYYAKKQLFSFYRTLLGFDKQKNVDRRIFFLHFFKDNVISSRGPLLLLKICFQSSFQWWTFVEKMPFAGKQQYFGNKSCIKIFTWARLSVCLFFCYCLQYHS